MIVGRRSVCVECEDELEASDDIDVDEGLRLSLDRSDDEELDRGAAVGMITPACFILERENFGALLARSGSTGPVEGAIGGATASAHRPLGVIGFGPLDEASEVDDNLEDSFGPGNEEKSRRGVDDQVPLSLAARLAVGRSRSITDGPPKASCGEAGGLRSPPMPTTQLLFFSCFCTGPSSSTCWRSGLDMRTWLRRNDALSSGLEAGGRSGRADNAGAEATSLE